MTDNMPNSVKHTYYRLFVAHTALKRGLLLLSLHSA